MVDIREVEGAIAEIERTEPSISSMTKLAALYIVRDHILGVEKKQNIQAYSFSPAPQKIQKTDYGDTDFLKIVSRKDSAAAWSVMDELMDTLRIVNAKVYSSVMEKLRRI